MEQQTCEASDEQWQSQSHRLNPPSPPPLADDHTQINWVSHTHAHTQHLSACRLNFLLHSISPLTLTQHCRAGCHSLCIDPTHTFYATLLLAYRCLASVPSILLWYWPTLSKDFNHTLSFSVVLSLVSLECLWGHAVLSIEIPSSPGKWTWHSSCIQRFRTCVQSLATIVMGSNTSQLRIYMTTYNFAHQGIQHSDTC